MYKDDLNKVRIGTWLVFTGNDELGLDGYTEGKAYMVSDVFDDNSGFIIENDCGIRQLESWCNVMNYFDFFVKEEESQETDTSKEKVNHPSHYSYLKDLCGVEVIDITRHMNFNLGNVIKYVLRAGHKKEEGMGNRQKEIEDLKKAAFYINDEIKRLENVQ